MFPITRVNLPFHAIESSIFFSDPIACFIFLNHLSEAIKKYCFKLWAYVIMPDHIHLLIWPGERADDVGKFLHRIKGKTGKNYRSHVIESLPELFDDFYINENGKKKFKFWQSGGASIEIYGMENRYIIQSGI